jgi:hypothetical protein
MGTAREADMASNIPRDLRRVAFYKNRDGSLATDKQGNALVDSLGMPGRRSFSPIWTMVGSEGRKVDGEIPQRYHVAAISLATCSFFRNLWAGDFDDSRFFMIRDQWIKACETARAHDWQAQITEHRHRWSLDRRAAELSADVREFRNAMAADRHGGAQKLAYILWAAFEDRPLDDDDVLSMTSSVPTGAVLSGLDRFADYCAMPLGRGTGTFPFGPIHYLRLPRRLPDPEVALALELADLFSYWRADRHHTTLSAGREPVMASRTPWKQLAQFVDAAFDNDATTKGLQRRAQAMNAAGVLVWGLPTR